MGRTVHGERWVDRHGDPEHNSGTKPHEARLDERPDEPIHIPSLKLSPAGNDDGARWGPVMKGAAFTACPKPAVESTSKVARDGIEPPTRGFSVRCSTN